MDPDAIRKFATSLKGRLIAPGDDDYEVARRVQFWNARTSKRPAMIVRCAHVDDVRRSVEFGRIHRLETAVRSGGHSLLGWGTTDGLLVDLTGLGGIQIDPERRLCRAAGGVLADPLNTAAARHGLAPVLGECGTVGVGGLTLGGGLGWLSGLHGASSDNLVSATLVTAGGDIVQVDSDENADLFWAIRGGGGNFGVATEFQLRLHPLTDVLAGELRYGHKDARAVLQFLREFMATSPDSLQISIGLNALNPALKVTLCYAGELAQGEKLLRPLRTIAPPTFDSICRKPHAMIYEPTPSPETDAPGVRTSNPGSGGIGNGFYLAQLSDASLDVILGKIGDAPRGATKCVFVLDHYMHGQVCRISPEATAFELRQPGAIHGCILTAWEAPGSADRCMTWADQTWKRLVKYPGDRMFANFQSYEGAGAAEALFGRNHSRLVSIKQKYDPENFFRRNPNVNPMGS